jgi:signal transduction histidine kinase
MSGDHDRPLGEGRRVTIPAKEAVFVAKAAHELRGAVGGIELLASVLADRVGQLTTDEDLAALLRRLADQSARVESMAEQLLDLTRFGDGRCATRPVAVNVARLLDDIVGAEALDPSHAVVIDVADDLTIETDRLALEQIVANLVRNARAHGGTTISLEGHVDDRHLVLRVVDDGPGVPEHVRDRLFEPFVRDDAAERDGHGLGLAIVAELAMALRGIVVYEPNEPTGAAFSVTLPLR